MAVIIYDDIFLKHDIAMHPECPQRLTNTIAHLKATGLWDRCQIHTPREATIEELEYTHSPAHVKAVRETAGIGGYFDADTQASGKSYEAALKAAGAVMDGVDIVMSNKEKAALCLVRPPGHHATSFKPMGFCLFNNIAVATKYAMRKHSLERIFIIDFDVHHGNGTQEIFYNDPSVLYCSLHRYPFYPGTGATSERGSVPGEGYNINIPLAFGITDDQYLAELDNVLNDAADKFAPQLVMVSAGFDAYESDPIAGLGLSIEIFSGITERIRAFAEKHSKGRIVSALEGGYHLKALPLCVERHLKALM